MRSVAYQSLHSTTVSSFPVPALVEALLFSRYRCAAARFAARVRAACAQCVECEHLADGFRLPLCDVGAGWKSSWILVSFSPPSTDEVLLIDRVEDQLKEPDRFTGTVLGLELSNVFV